jgi:DNA-binding XRE family transcriptional regulator
MNPDPHRTEKARATRAGPNVGATPDHRIPRVMAHTVRYSFEGQARLAEDCGVSRSTISRLLSGRRRPTYELARRVVAALEAALGLPLDPREVFSPGDGTYPTPSACVLCGCAGCMPEAAYDRCGNVRPEYRGMSPGDWSLSPLAAACDPDPAHQPNDAQW